jgi:IS5 family transposase
MEDFCKGRTESDHCGANGMSAEQVVRCAIVKMLFGFTYRHLAFHMVDSQSIRRFCRIGIGDKGFKKSILNRNIKALSARTWQAVNRELVGYAKDRDIEKGRQVRIDCTVVESNIHVPCDSTLLWDCVRVLSRLLHKAKDDYGLTQLHFQDHRRRAHKRMLAIQYAKNKKQRELKYKDLLKVTRKSIGYANSAINMVQAHPAGASLMQLCNDLQQYCELAKKVFDQTERRVIRGESVPARDKIVSLFEPHADIIVKDRRETFYGHKVCLTGGVSNLIVDCLITNGPLNTNASTST